MNSERSNQISKAVVVLTLVICLLPIWLLPYFHTGDGPAHIYCAKVFSELVLDSDAFYGNYFELNNIPVPNSVVQFLFASLLPFITFSLANKVVISIVIVVIFFGYNYFLKSLNVNVLTSFAVVLLVYSFPMKMGLYSMLIGIGMMLIASGYYIRYRKRMVDRDIMIFTIFVMLTWFCHLFTFFGLVFLIGVYEITCMVLKQESSFAKRKNLKLLICFVPAILFTTLFSNTAFYSTPIKFAPDENLLYWISNLKVMNFCDTDKEQYIKWIFCLSGIIAVFIFIRSSEKNVASVFLLMSIMLLLTMAFVFPENYFSGGFINIRLTFFMLVVSCAFIDLMISVVWINIGKNILLLAATSIASVNVYINQKLFSDDISVMLESASSIKEKSVVLPLNYSSIIMEYNFSLYLACEKEIVMLDNAEAATPNSLVRWREEIWKPELIGNYLESNHPEINVSQYEFSTGVNIDYLFFWRGNSSHEDNLTQPFNRIYSENNACIMERNPSK